MERIELENFWRDFAAAAKPDEEVYRCLDCRDSGWLLGPDGAYPCHCQQEGELQRRKLQAGLSPAMLTHTFANFDFAYYSPHRYAAEGGESYQKIARDAVRQAKAFVAAMLHQEPTSGLCLIGEVGVGKTYLAAAIANALLERGVALQFVVVPDFLDLLRSSYDSDSQYHEAAILKRVQNTPVLFLDDLGAHNYSDWTRNKIFSLLNYRLNHQLPCVITTNLDLNLLKTVIGSRSVSRICEMCRICHLAAERDIRNPGEPR